MGVCKSVPEQHQDSELPTQDSCAPRSREKTNEIPAYDENKIILI